jgi:high affinity Mn2+ porin
MTKARLGHRLAVLADGAFLLWAAAARADDSSPAPEDWSLHGQATFTEQYHPAFASPYRGRNSLDPGSRGDETVDVTLFMGVRRWNGGEAYADPEIDQGFGLSDTIGVAGFPSGEAYKIGDAVPYFRLQRLFVRQAFDLGGDSQAIEPDANQLGGTRTADNIVITLGKFSVTDVFDTNSYAHDPKHDFLNWSVIDAGAFDYAADSWGYTYGIASEWTQSWWSLRAGVFDLSVIPNEPNLETEFQQFEIVAEAEERHSWWGEAGKLKLLGFVDRGRMGDYNDAVEFGIATNSTPSTALVRNYASRPGASINFEQQVVDNLGIFARASLNDGSKEAYEFTEINRSLSVGLSLKGADWGRSNDTIGVAGVVNALSDSARRYFAAGGLGILIGDGQLPRYATENIFETYYSVPVTSWFTATADYQFIDNPAYNSDRGPVSVLGVRLHAQI